MTELIDRAAAIAALDQHAKGDAVIGGQTFRTIKLEDALDAIAALPEAPEVRPLLAELPEVRALIEAAKQGACDWVNGDVPHPDKGICFAIDAAIREGRNG